MTSAKEAGAREPTSAKGRADLLEQYGCGPIRFSGNNDGLYKRHLLFDDIVAPAAAGPQERFRAVARSVRDVLSQRWSSPKPLTNAKTLSACTTCRWNSSSAGRWRTMSPTCC
jgi:hypothetical protein